jgi:hypothetical protein
VKKERKLINSVRFQEGDMRFEKKNTKEFLPNSTQEASINKRNSLLLNKLPVQFQNEMM